MTDLTAYYLAALPGRIEAIEAALQSVEKDPAARAAIRRIAHSLKGSGASYGFPRISEAAGEAEHAADERLVDQVGALVQVLRDTVATPDARSVAEERILVVDDDPEIVHLVSAVLQAKGRTVLAAHDVASAEEALRERAPTLVLLDLVLPDGDGRSLLMRMRERPATASIPVIVLSATSSEQARAECMSLGADHVLPKPFDPSVLAATVRHQLQRAASLRHTTHRDGLTALPNRAAFGEAWADVAKQPGDRALIAMIDLDRFKTVNDRHGPVVGDKLLRRFADVATASLPHARILARWGGEEFAAIYSGPAAASADSELSGLLERLRAEPIDLDGIPVQLTVSIGLADVTERPALEQAVARADYFLSLAKSTGRNRLASSESSVEKPEKRVLLAEDDDLTASLILHRLRREGLDVDHHTEGTQALEAARNGRYALAILDVKMPGMDGFQLLTALRSMPAFTDTPILMLTSMGSESDVVRGFDLGATDYMLKPFSPVELVARVQRHLRFH